MTDKNSNKKNQIRQENEELKKKMEEEFGAASQWSSPDLSPEMENDFLKHIMEFENAWKNTKKTTVYEFLGKPVFRRVENLQPEEISAELERMYTLMEKNQISLDTICEVPDDELYRFITEELFNEEIDDVRIEGMMSCYTYEEFHPNHEYDLNRYANDFIQSYLDKTSYDYLHEISSDASKSDWHKHFRDAFSRFDVQKFEIESLNYNLETAKAEVGFECDIQAKVEGASDLFRFVGKGKFGFVHQWDFWYVDSVEFPKPYNESSAVRN